MHLGLRAADGASTAIQGSWVGAVSGVGAPDVDEVEPVTVTGFWEINAGERATNELNGNMAAADSG